MQPNGRDRRQETQHRDWDVRYPSMAPGGRIAYMLGGDIRVFEPRRGADERLDVVLPSERSLTRNRYADAGDTLTWFDVSPDGERFLVTRSIVPSGGERGGIALIQNWLALLPSSGKR